MIHPNGACLKFVSVSWLSMIALRCDAWLASTNWARAPARPSRFVQVKAGHGEGGGHGGGHILRKNGGGHGGSFAGLGPNMRVQEPSKAGHISLVGAGPGDPNLLTLQAMKLIQKADLVIADRLISQEILDLVSCDLKIANKYKGCAEEAQQEIYRWTNEAYAAGKHVLRLKIGDPFLFGRGGEEVLYFRKTHGIDIDVVPGVSASYAAPLVANIPLTHRGASNRVVISTGHGQENSYVNVPPYDKDQTVVLLMAVGRLDNITKQMLTQGYPPSTLVAIIEKASTPQQRTIVDRLDTIAATGKEADAKPPATIVVGSVVGVLQDQDQELETGITLSPAAQVIDDKPADSDQQPLAVSGPAVHRPAASRSAAISQQPQGVLFAQISQEVVSIYTAALISLFMVCGVSFAMIDRHRRSRTLEKRPLLAEYM